MVWPSNTQKVLVCPDFGELGIISQMEMSPVWFLVKAMPGLQAKSLIGGVQETAHGCFSCT